MVERIAAYWQSRPERERSMLTAGAVVAAIMLVVVLVWLPLLAIRGRSPSAPRPT